MTSKRSQQEDAQQAPLAKKLKPVLAMEDHSPMANGGPVPIEIDEDLHSRQLAVYGRESMRKMATANVLISGLTGLGVEVGEGP